MVAMVLRSRFGEPASKQQGLSCSGLRHSPGERNGEMGNHMELFPPPVHKDTLGKKMPKGLGVLEYAFSLAGPWDITDT